jgi:hypothetical protein
LASAGPTVVHEHSCSIDNDKIYVCVGNHAFCLKIPELQLIWKHEIDEATNFGIYPFHTDFIIHGELSITRITKEGIIVWQKYGSDIFTTQEAKDDFYIEDDYIYAQSWDGRNYQFDYDGNEHLSY